VVSAATIAAIATGPAAGGIGIIRLSGPLALAAARTVASLPALVTPRLAHLATIRVGGQVVDEGLALYFPAPRSFTGDDVVELQLHGAPRLLRLVLDALLTVDGVRLATAGEFTRRAFVAGRVDLTRAEAVADLIAAESEAQVRAAAAQLSGELATRLQSLEAAVLGVRADVEGVLDFPEEAEGADHDLAPRLDAALREVTQLVADGARGALLRRGARVVLFGPVNAGKSTLFNRLVGEARAIVDAEPGTTRDTLEARLELDGLAVTLVDTAGFREAPGRLEALGIERSRAALASADLAILVAEPQNHPAWQREFDQARRIDVLAKADLPGGPSGGLRVSGLTGEGVDHLRATLVERLGGAVVSSVLVTSQRHLECLRRVHHALETARAALDVSTLEVVAGELGLAMEALTELTGEDASSELLDAVFARFCIGK
jgi:tRNA modification GTPase